MFVLLEFKNKLSEVMDERYPGMCIVLVLGIEGYSLLVPGGIPDVVCGCLVDLVYGVDSQRFQLFAS